MELKLISISQRRAYERRKPQDRKYALLHNHRDNTYVRIWRMQTGYPNPYKQ